MHSSRQYEEFLGNWETSRNHASRFEASQEEVTRLKLNSECSAQNDWEQCEKVDEYDSIYISVAWKERQF